MMANDLFQLPAQADLFDEFWRVYPRKIAKPKARKSFEKLSPGQQRAVIDHVAERIEKDAQWQEKKFIPYPATFLNQERWEDEYEEVEEEEQPFWKQEGWESPEEKEQFEVDLARWRNDQRLGVNLHLPKPEDPRKNRT